MGASAHAAADFGARVVDIRMWRASWWRIGRLALFIGILHYASVPGIRAPGTHRYRGNLLVGSGDLGVCPDVGNRRATRRAAIRADPRVEPVIKVFGWTAVLCLRGVRSQCAM